MITSCASWERFPDVETLAEATEDDVLKCWQGLGYYSRARNLHCAARQIVAAGKFPDDYENIRKLKGVGDYTAAAISSFAFGLPYAVVDGNVYRVLSRYFGITEPIDTTAGKKYFAGFARGLLPKGAEGADYNQAIMDFGALQCVPRSPFCAECPFADSCMAYRMNSIHDLPVKSRTLKVSERYLHYIYIQAEGKAALPVVKGRIYGRALRALSDRDRNTVYNYRFVYRRPVAGLREARRSCMARIAGERAPSAYPPHLDL